MKQFIVGKSYGWAEPGYDSFRVTARTAKTIYVTTGDWCGRLLVRTDEDGTEWVQDSSSRSKKYREAMTSRPKFVEPFVVTVHGCRFHAQYDGRIGAMQISRLSPYDLTNYHWARSRTADDDVWGIFSHDGRLVRTVIVPFTQFDPYAFIAAQLDSIDEEAGLKPCIDRT